MAVTRCICHDRSFEELRSLAAAENLALEQLKERTGCCTGCGMCEPYVRLMLTTGRTTFPVLSAAETAEIMRSPSPQPRQ